MIDRYWFLTNTCYGTWLPGDEHGFVGRVWEHRPAAADDAPRITHALPGTPYDEHIPGLERSARALLKGPPVYLETAHAEILLAQFPGNRSLPMLGPVRCVRHAQSFPHRRRRSRRS